MKSPGTGVKSLATYLTAVPNAKFSTTASGSIRLVAGFGAVVLWAVYLRGERPSDPLPATEQSRTSHVR